MIEALLGLPTHERRRLADALDAGMLDVSSTQTAVRSILGTRAGGEEILAALAEFKNMGINARAAAAWIRTVEKAVSNTPKPDLVWSGPEVPGVPARDTRRVYEELLGTAKRSIWACSYAYYGKKAFEVMANRMDECPEVDVVLMLNIHRDKGDTTGEDELVRKFADRFWKKDWPGEARPRVYYDPRSLAPGHPDGVLHAKGVVVDDEAVFVTSANFTEAALDRNIELGLLVRDRALATSVGRHFRGLIERKLLSALPAG